MGGVSGLATVIARTGAPDHLSLTPAQATLAPGGTTDFSAQMYDSKGNQITGAAAAWSVATAAAGTGCTQLPMSGLAGLAAAMLLLRKKRAAAGRPARSPA